MYYQPRGVSSALHIMSKACRNIRDDSFNCSVRRLISSYFVNVLFDDRVDFVVVKKMSME